VAVIGAAEEASGSVALDRVVRPVDEALRVLAEGCAAPAYE
jgi:hypothetical protein